MRIGMRLWVAALALLPLACSGAQDEPYRPGVEYMWAREAGTPVDAKRVEVVEVFWYGCTHCYDFEPYINGWVAKKPADVDFRRLPASLGRPVGIMHSKAFFAAQTLGVSQKIHTPLFDAIHKKHQMMDTPDALRAFFIATAGVKAEDFDNAFSGFMVDNQVRLAEATLQNAYGITSVPTVVVGGRYWSSGSLAGGHDRLLKVIDFLVDKVRKERK